MGKKSASEPDKPKKLYQPRRGSYAPPIKPVSFKAPPSSLPNAQDVVATLRAGKGPKAFG